MVISRLVTFLSLSALLLPLMSGEARAQAEVPEPLQPWVDWTMVDVPNHGCSNLQGTLRCAWPGRLELDARPQGASFEMEVWLDRAGELALPGGRGSWPQEVSAGGRALVVTGESTPRVTLEAGAHTLRGRFIFSELPEVLPVPAHLGIIELTVNGQSVEHPRHDAEGRLWLKEGRSGTVTEADSLRATVYRRFDDGVPLRITTRLELNVAGRAREVTLGQVLLEGSRAIALNAPLPVKVEPGGQLSVYVRPGTHFITIDAVIAHKPTADEDAPGVETLRVPPHQEGIFDEREVWAWFPDELVRSVELDGLSAVEPDRTTLPAEWHGTTTFLAAPGEALTLRETRRGQLDTSPNLLNLERQIWLDLDGEGATSRDSLTGTMYRGWRLDYGEAAELGRVAQRGTDLLITRDEEGQEGVEIRDASLDITADIRIEEGISRFDVVGWQHDLQHLSATLHTPPGWSVLGGRGVDAIAGSWLHSWDLLAFFFVLIVALSFAKLFGWPWGLAAAVALCLTHDMPEAPRWVWVHLLATAALLRALTSGRFRKAVVLYRAGALFILFITLAPFIHRQIQQAIAPQAYRQTYSDSWLETAMTGAADSSYAEYEEAPAAPQELAPEADRVSDKGASFMRSVPGDASQYRKAEKSVMQIDPNAVVQTGPGVPSWSWQSWQLIWTGPVRAGHEVRLWLISPAQNVALTLVRLLLLIALALVIISRREMVWHGPDDDRDGPRDRNDGPSRFPGGGKKAAATLGVLLALSVGLVPSAHAQDFPPQPMLDALKARQIAAASCQGPCVSVSQATIAIDDLDVVIRAAVHAQQPAGWPLPGPDDPLRITEVRLNGQVTHQLRRSSEGLISVRLPEGVHRLEVRGRLMNRASLTLQFDPATRPHHTTFISDDWSADGIDRRGVVDGTLQLTRLADASAAPGQESEELLASRELEPWFEVQRHLALGVSWQMRTTIIRPRTDRPQPLRFPLLEGEAVITEGFRVEQGHVLLDFPRGKDSLSFESELPVQPSFVLNAATERPWTEIWTAECSAIWRCDYEGIAPIETVRDGLYQPRWLPWPGESLTVSVTRPEGSPGQATTVEKVHYQITPGERLLQASLELRIRSSRGDWQTITLPEGAEVQNVSRDDEATAIRPRDGALQLPVRPGAQTYRIEWQQPWEHRLIERFPAVDIGSAAVNVTQVMRTSDHRWLLWTLGPDWGPAVLFWSHLLMLLILATLLGLWKYSPLRRHEWVLLTLGLAPQPIFVLVPVVAFFMIFQWRRRSPLKSPWQFNLVQLALIALTLAAIVCLYGSIHENLLVNVDMQVQGMDSHNGNLRWYTDRIGSQLPAAGILSLPILVWRGLMLLWALWLSWKLLKWAPWAWQAFSFEGIWKALPNRFALANNATDGVVQPPVGQNADGGTVDSSPPEDAADGEVAPPGPEDDAGRVEPPKTPEE
ncbi:hypothetical protein FRC96_17145 [Lujinxingia vulgaris]|uniref:Uncharacterized protein n=1 Tax=Lujinxingia vulgaris TaxID=2600176 RepID=A0A5C6WZF9_9DELT|nr:hypothetical protein [Lujinxingia vulgaris]TXD32565.1 hypothetical protein FRC96_17145 [Lujinxingia vulgaris]